MDEDVVEDLVLSSDEDGSPYDGRSVEENDGEDKVTPKRKHKKQKRTKLLEPRKTRAESKKSKC